jgi:GrpB-like predicted nucleotidyltransferase (UPF0157 family)
MTDSKGFTWITEVRIVPYDPSWPDQFEAEAEILRQLLGESALPIHHVGSTAVPGLSAKPVVDLMVEVPELTLVQSMTSEFEAAGYEVRGEGGIPGRHFVTRNAAGQRTHDVHIFPAGHRELQHMLLFRDRMRENPEEARAYSELKHRLAERYREDPDRYTQEKSKFIVDAIWRQREKLASR